MPAIEPPVVVALPTFYDERGMLTAVEREPFEINRAFWLHGTQAQRGGHAHKSCEQLIVCLHGTAHVKAGDLEVWLQSPIVGLYVPPGNFVDIDARGAAVLVLCSEYYDGGDYVRESERGSSYEPDHHWV